MPAGRGRRRSWVEHHPHGCMPEEHRAEALLASEARKCLLHWANGVGVHASTARRGRRAVTARRHEKASPMSGGVR